MRSARSSRLVSRVGRRAAAQDGVTILFVLGALVVSMAIGLAVIAVALSSSQLTAHDARQKRAQQAADSGIQSLLYQQGQDQAGNAGSTFDLNGGLLGSAGFLDCVEPTFSSSLQITGLITTTAATGGSCPGGGGSGKTTLEAQALGNHAYDQAEIFPAATSLLSGGSPVELQPRIVSLGWDDQASPSVYSREEAIVNPIEPLPVIGGNGNIAVNGVTLGALGATVNAALATTLGSLATSINLSASVLSGDINAASVIDGDLEAASNVTLPAVDAALNLSLHNSASGSTKDNGLAGVVQLGGTLSPTGAITTAEVIPTAPPAERPITVSSATPSCPTTAANCGLTLSGSATYNATTDTVTVPSGSSVTITTPGVYVFCNVNASGSVTVNPSSSIQPVEIFIDNPYSARCAPPVNATLTTAANSVTGHSEDSYGNFIAQSGVACTTCLATPSELQIYVVGDDPLASSPYDDQTYVQIGTGYSSVKGGALGGLVSGTANPAAEAMVVYAPTSEVSMTTVTCTALNLVCVPGAFEGNLIGDDVSATALAFEQDLDLGNYALYNGISLYHVQKYIQCSPLTALTGNVVTDTSGC